MVQVTVSVVTFVSKIQFCWIRIQLQIPYILAHQKMTYLIQFENYLWLPHDHFF